MIAGTVRKKKETFYVVIESGEWKRSSSPPIIRREKDAPLPGMRFSRRGKKKMHHGRKLTFFYEKSVFPLLTKARKREVETQLFRHQRAYGPFNRLEKKKEKKSRYSLSSHRGGEKEGTD